MSNYTKLLLKAKA